MNRIVSLCFILCILTSVMAFSQSNKLSSPMILGGIKLQEGPSLGVKLSRIVEGNRIGNIVNGSWRMKSQETFAWHESTSTWRSLHLISNSYDAGGRITARLSQEWMNNVWTDFNKDNYTYDAQGDNTLIIGQYWIGAQWVDGSSRTLAYNAAHRVTSDIYAYWGGSAWINSSKTLYTYDVNGHETEVLQQNWTSTWENSLRTTSTYNGQGYKTQMIFQSWETGAWLNQDRWTYTNNVLGQPTSMLMETWSGAAWTTSQKVTYSYTAHEELSQVFIQMWYTNQWNNDYQENYTYDANGNMNDMIAKLWNGSAWVNQFKHVYTWEQATGVGERLLSANRYQLLNNFPNPFNPSTEIQFMLPAAGAVTLKVYDVLGREVSTLLNERMPAGAHSIKWDAAEMPSGVYFYRLASGNYSSVKKMLLLR